MFFFNFFILVVKTRVIILLRRQYHEIRQLVTDNIMQILKLITNVDYDWKLPPPEKVAQELNTFSLKSVKEWTTTYGSSYRKLDLCYTYLSRKKCVSHFNRLFYFTAYCNNSSPISK